MRMMFFLNDQYDCNDERKKNSGKVEEPMARPAQNAKMYCVNDWENQQQRVTYFLR